MIIREIVSAVVALVYVIGGITLYMLQDKLLYHPTPKHIPTKFKNFTLINDSENINVIVVNPGHSNAILYFGGNAEVAAQSSYYIEKQFPDITVYLMDYRGFGDSTGKPREKFLCMDALKLYDRVSPKHKKISIGGRSLGSAIAVYVASKRNISKLALITPFDSIKNVAQGRYPFYPISMLLKDNYDSVSRVKDINASTLIIYAQYDDVVPYKYTKNLINSFPSKQLKVEMIKNRGHNDISDDAGYYKIMQDFIGEG